MRKEVFSTRERWLYLNSIGYDPSVRSKLHQEDRFQLNKTFPLRRSICATVSHRVSLLTKLFSTEELRLNHAYLPITFNSWISMRDKRRQLDDRGNDNSRSQQFVRKKFLSFIY